MPYNLKFYKTETATARCLAGTGPTRTYTATSESIIAQRDVDRKALGWATAAAQSLLRCVIPGPQGVLSVVPLENYETEGDKGGAYPTKAYLLTNTGKDDINWSLVLGDPWLTADISSGHLYVGESVTVTLGVDDSTLAADATYASTVDFINDTNGNGDTSLLAQVLVYPLPQVSASYASEAGTATLIGHSEFATPSSPPKKYLTMTLSGTLVICNYGNFSTCGSGPQPTQGQFTYQYSGAITYNPATGVPTDTTLLMRDNANVICGAGAVLSNMGHVTTAVETLTFGAAFNRVTTPTERYQTSDLTCVAGGILHAPNPEIVTAVTNRDDLSDEDTEDAAIARASKTVGTSAQAYRELRGAADFTMLFREVEITLDFTGLRVGFNYEASIDLLTENYGGGAGVTTQRTYNFTAIATTHQIVDSLSAADGKQVTASNPSVVRVP